MTFKSIAHAFDPHQNNFDLIRLFAALLVLISHCFPLTGQAHEPFANYLGEYDTGGGWGVSIFFVISGFLVTRSVMGRPVGIYAMSRTLRIVPALILVTCFEALVVGPTFTTLSLREYFQHGETLNHLGNASVFWLRQALPGLFMDNPAGATVNGSLWTLPIESGFYVLLPVLAFAGLLKPGRVLILLAATALALIYGTLQLQWGWNNQGPQVFPGGPAYYVAKEGVFFLIGGAMWIHRDHIPQNKYVALGCLALLVAFAWRDYRLVAMYIALPYLTIYLALLKFDGARLYEKVGDISYGTYLFAYPVQNAIVAAHAEPIGPGRMALFAVPIVLSLALLSWRFVEKPALALRHGFAGARAAP
ncbi:MAG: acyltransferase [Alphaproteobacteria bacterium]|nr:acyltransferase [Alphaproteobacteria bacterium]